MRCCAYGELSSHQTFGMTGSYQRMIEADVRCEAIAPNTSERRLHGWAYRMRTLMCREKAYLFEKCLNVKIDPLSGGSASKIGELCTWQLRSGARGRFCNVVDVVNRLENEARNTRQGRLADRLTRMDFVILDELGYLPFAKSGGQLLFHLISRSMSAPQSSSPPISPSANGQASSRTPR